MVSFQCDGCADTVKKPQLDKHRQRCWASFTCLDCSTTFQNQEYKSHTSCISEAEKYQGKLFKGARSGGNSNAASTAVSPNATPADSPAPSEAGTSTIHPSRLNQLQDPSPYPSNEGRGFARGRGGFAPRGRGAFGGRGGRTFQPTGQNLVSAEGAMRSWGSTPVASDSEGPATPAEDEKKKKKRKGDKGGTGSKANSSSKLKNETTQDEPASKKRKFDETESTPAAPSAAAAGPPSDKALKRLRKHMSKLEAKSETSIPLSQWLEKVSQGKEKSVDQSDILQGVKVAFVDGVWRLSA